MQALDRLVGTWRISGEATGECVYQWMDGRFFLLQDGDIRVGDMPVLRNHCVIGRERHFDPTDTDNDIKVSVFSNTGDISTYVYELDGDTFHHWAGKKGSDTYYKGHFSPDGNTLTGEWTWPGGGYQATMTRIG
jgi:hypothetical protein